MSLVVTDLAIARGGVPLLDGVAFAVAPGSALILRGPNGVGKTTLLRTIAGLQPVTRGTIEVDADDLAYAAHADGVKGVLTVDENLSFWQSIYGTKLLQSVKIAMDLDALSGRPVQQLSAGQKRRLGLARLLVTGRRVWILDEPTVSLDVQSVALFAGVLDAHLAGGGVALIATHDAAFGGSGSLDLAPFRAKGRGGLWGGSGDFG